MDNGLAMIIGDLLLKKLHAVCIGDSPKGLTRCLESLNCDDILFTIGQDFCYTSTINVKYIDGRSLIVWCHQVTPCSYDIE